MQYIFLRIFNTDTLFNSFMKYILTKWSIVSLIQLPSQIYQEIKWFIKNACINFVCSLCLLTLSIQVPSPTVLGGLLSAHLFTKRAGMEVEPGWPCTGPLLRLAEDVARRLLPGTVDWHKLSIKNICSKGQKFWWWVSQSLRRGLKCYWID